MQFKRLLALSLIGSSSIGLGSAAWAVPYAANVRNTTGSTWEFVLNEAADNVTVTRDGANPANLGALGVGRHTFDMTGFSTFDIKVAKNAAAGWTSIHGAGNPFSNFTLPSGVAINTNPSNLAYFGTVYVGNANPAATVAGRLMGDGIYALTPDMVGVDLASSFAVVADANDTTQAKAPGFLTDGSTSSSPWRLNLDADGNLLVADWSDSRGGLKYAAKDLTSGGLVFANEDGITPLLTNGSGQEFHGSIAAKVYTTGSVGNNLVVYGMDEDMDSDGETAITAATGNHIWKWNVGNATGYDQPPQLWINATDIPKTTDNRSNFLNLNTGVSAGMVYHPGFNKWYLTEPRSNGDESCITILSAPGDGSSTVEWSSLQFSIDNNLDGLPAFPTTPLGNTKDIQDMFRYAREVAITNDGKYMVVNRSTYVATLEGDWSGNGVVDARDYVLWRNDPTLYGGDPAGYDQWRANFGYTTATAPTASVNRGMGDGDIIIIPLDANGVPDIQVVGGKITNVQTIPLVANTRAHTSGAQVEFDAAGNLYVAHSGLTTGNPANTGQLVQVFSPGGNWIATTSSNGTFTRATAGSGSALDGGAVPEPGSLALAVFGLLVASACRGKRGA